MVIAKFTCNSFVNRTTSKSPHEIVYGLRLRQPVDLIPMVDHYKVSGTAFSFATHMHVLHKEINDKIEQSNLDYKLRADVRKGFKTFNIGDFVMVQICPKQFSPEAIKKLHACSVGVFKILTKLNDNAYIIYLPEDFGISLTCNIEILVDYKGPNFNPSDSLVDDLTLEPFSERSPTSSTQILILEQQRKLIRF